MFSKTAVVSAKTIRDETLLRFFERYKDAFDSDFPRRLPPIVLFDGIAYVFRKLDQASENPDVLVLHVLEAGSTSVDEARYALALVREGSGYSVRMIYEPTGELEGLTTVEPGKVVWSPGTLANSRHVMRTKYYIGFTYLLAEQAIKILGSG